MSEILAHISMAFKIPCAIDQFRELIKEDWTYAAIRYYQFTYTYHEKDEEEREWSRGARKILKETLPEKYREGIHLLATRAAFMGEDIFVVDGSITSSCHSKHTVCGKYNLLPRGEIKRGMQELWCAKCDKYVPDSEVKNA